ncbi:DUF3488 and transglutaminase-like domain-containing protein [Streptomyces sp. ACA25]|uniref:transglutaminase family protein n=1 Tax=Streptomyces sp. ACA25 TaxID=3022596 RepID=UPI0023078F64|nr:DUF3488 and transglutaminase-like domain-containing protein [Streptomyces sp. ACA25]MDB1089876.1 DUF3488 and transglutaminase-like domain-containing protein [Streptomyces sp. ACA25]
MDGRIRIAAAAWAATVAAACTLLPLVDSGAWLVQAALLLAAQGTVGAVLRGWGRSGVLTFTAQILTSGLLLTLVTVPGYALGGLVPGPEALRELGLLLSAGTSDIGHYIVPAPVTDGIQLLLLSGVLTVGLLVDLLAVTLRSAAPAGLPLLALYAVAAGVDQGGSHWPYFLIAASGFLLLLLAESRDRLAHWGRYQPAPARPSTARPEDRGARAAGPRLRTGRRIAVVALSVAALAPLLLPSLGEGLLDLSGRVSGGVPGEPALTAVNPVVALQDQLNQPQNRTVLTYRTDSTPREMYLRLTALDRFDGESWSSSGNTLDEAPEVPWPVAGLSGEVDTTMVSTSVTADESYAQRSLPVPSPAIDIAAEGAWVYDIYSRTLTSSRRDLTTAGLTYEVRHLLLEPTAEQLAGAPAPASSVIREEFTQVPDSLPEQVHRQALEVTAGAANDHERAVALQNWFTREGGFRYDTDVASGTGAEAITRFLEAREGFCIHFAFSMAAMARTLDIPAQVSVGFTPGMRQADGSYRVGIHDAHAWPELYFEGVGWVRFEPTPGQGSLPPYTRPERPGPSERSRETETPEREDASDGPDATGALPADPERCDPMLEPGACDEAASGPVPGPDGGAAASWLPFWAAGGGLLLAALAAAPRLWRSRSRARRLAPGAGPLAAWRELSDTAWDFGILPEPSETPRRAAQRMVAVGGLSETAATAAHRVAGAVEQELYAARSAAGEVGDVLAAEVRCASAGLRATAGRRLRLRAALLPPSAARLTRVWAERRARAGAGATGVLDRLARALSRPGRGA